MLLPIPPCHSTKNTRNKASTPVRDAALNKSWGNCDFLVHTVPSNLFAFHTIANSRLSPFPVQRYRELRLQGFFSYRCERCLKEVRRSNMLWWQLRCIKCQTCFMISPTTIKTDSALHCLPFRLRRKEKQAKWKSSLTQSTTHWSSSWITQRTNTSFTLLTTPGDQCKMNPFAPALKGLRRDLKNSHHASKRNVASASA